MKFAIIGCGRISAKHVEAIIANSEDAELIAVYDELYDLAEDRKNQYESCIPGSKVKVYENYYDFLNDEDIDVVTISSISGYHAKQAIDCLRHNKHVIVEKPMALNLEDADEVINIAKEKDRVVCVSHQNRFMPSVKRLKEAVDKGKFGKIIHGSARTLWNRNNDYYNQAAWRGTKDLDGGTLLNQCIHNIDLLQWIMGGEIEEIFLEKGTFIRDIETEDFGALIIKFKNQAIGVVEGSVCVYPENLEETLSIFGEMGTVVIKDGLVETWVFDDKEFTPPDKKETNLGHIPLYKDMIKSVNLGIKPLIDGEEGKKALEIILSDRGR